MVWKSRPTSHVSGKRIVDFAYRNETNSHTVKKKKKTKKRFNNVAARGMTKKEKLVTVAKTCAWVSEREYKNESKFSFIDEKRNGTHRDVRYAINHRQRGT